jgi:hypothetical protein
MTLSNAKWRVFVKPAAFPLPVPARGLPFSITSGRNDAAQLGKQAIRMSADDFWSGFFWKESWISGKVLDLKFTQRTLPQR